MLKKLIVFIFFVLFEQNVYCLNKDSLSIFNTISSEINLLEKEKDYGNSILILNNLTSLNELNHSNYFYGLISIQKLKTYKKFRKHSEGLNLALSLNEKLKENNKIFDCENKELLFRFLGVYMEDINNYTKSISFLKKIKKLECYEQTMFDVLTYQIAYLYKMDNQYPKALEVMQDYIEDLEEKKDSSILISAYNQYGLICGVDNKKTAINSYLKAITIIESIGKRLTLIPVLQGNIGHLLKLEKKYKQAYFYLEKDSKGSLKANEIQSYVFAEVELADLDYINKDYQKSNNRLNNLFSSYQDNIAIATNIAMLKRQALNYLALKKEKLAYKKLEKYTLLKDSVIVLRTKKHENLIIGYSKSIYKKTLERLNDANKIAKKDIALLKKNKEIEKQRNRFLIVFLILFIAFIFFVFKRINDAKIKNAIIIENELEINEQNLKLKIAEKKILEIQIVEDNKKINSLALELNLKQNFSNKLISKLEQNEKFSSSELRNIELFIQNELDLKSTRARLQKDIDSLGNIFFNSLKSKHPKLTESDLKLCSMIVLNLPNKEIAISKNIEINSVKISKNRLKKKLQLNSSNDLKMYLGTFL